MLLLAAQLALISPAEAATTALRIADTGPSTEGLATFRLDWDATSNSTYLVQSSTSLDPGAVWTTLDAVQPLGPSGSYKLQVAATDSTGLQSPPATFYRLVLPQPQISSVEPAIIPPGVPVDLYVLGQSFSTNVVLQINGVTQTGVIYQSSSTLVKPTFTPGVAGNYTVTLLVGGGVVSSFNVVCADPLANPELVLQPPPGDPPASPNKKEFKGHVTLLKAFDDGSDGESARIKTGHVTLMKAFDDGAGDAEAKKEFKGHVTLLKAFDDGSEGESARTKTGHVTLMKAFDDGSSDQDGAERRLPVHNLGSSGQDGVERRLPVHNLGSSGQDGVEACSGEVQECDVDLAVPGRGVDFVLARTYHSRTGHLVTFDDRWTFSYDVHCAQNSSGGMDVYDGTGRKDTFTLQPNSIYTCPQFFREGALSNNAFTLTFADTGRWVFNPFDGTATAGRLIQIITRNGDTMTLGYDTAGRLSQVVDDLNRTNTMSYNPAGQLASVTDFSGRTVTYAYYSGGETGGSPGDLKSVTSPPVIGTPNGNDFPDGKTVTYTYSTGYANDAENHLLLSVTDAKGQLACQYTYGHDSTDSANYLHCLTAAEGTNTPSCFHWTLVSRPAGSYATLKCIANDPVGNVTECFFDARNRCVIQDDYTGRATPGLPVTDSVNRPTGQLRATDPAYFESRWSWNNDSLCTLAVSPGGQQVQCVYQSDFDATTPPHKRADCRVVRNSGPIPVDLDGDGVADVTDRSWHFDYDPRFGSDARYGRIKVQFHWDRVGKGDGDSAVYVNPRSIARQQYFFNEHTGWSHGDDNPTESVGRKAMYQWIKASFDGIVPAGNGMAINQKGTGADANRTGGGPRPKGWDGTIKGLIVPSGNGVAINTKGTGADKGRVAGGPRPKGWDGTIKGLIIPSGNGVAINTKGTGADKNRTAGGAAFEDQWPMDGDLDFNDFCVSATDPRGNVTTAGYDTNGNVTHVEGHVVVNHNPFLIQRFAVYNSNGQLTTVTNSQDANGYRRVDTFSYYTSGPQAGYLQSCVEDANGLALTTAFEYDARGNVTRCIDPRTNDWLFTYNALDECVQSQSAQLGGGGGGGAGGSWRVTSQFAYDANENLVQCSTELRDAFGNLQGTRSDSLSYDGVDRLSQIALAVDAGHALTNRFVYDNDDECVQVLGGDAVSGADPHRTVAYEYDERGLLFRTITAPSSSIELDNQFNYTPDGLQKSVQWEPHKAPGLDSPEIEFDYDGFDRPASVTDAMGNQTVCFYDANDNLKVVRVMGETNDVPGSAGNVRLAESSYEYDGLDRCVVSHDLFFDVASQSPLAGSECRTTFAYAPNGDCASVTDTLGHTTSFGYDTACRPISVTDALGNRLSVVYDACSNPLSVTSQEVPAAGGKLQIFSISSVYDSFNRCVRATDSAGNTGTCEYDSLDRCVQTADPRGTQTFYSYDLLDRGTVIACDLDGDSFPDFTGDITTTFTWSSSSGDLLAMADSHTNTTSYSYDSLGRCLAVTHADGTQEQMTWDALGELVGEQDANGTTISNTYNLSRNIVHRDIAARNVLATTTFENFTYDGCGQMMSEANDSSSGAFTYDSLGDCVAETLSGLTTTSTYDAMGNRLSLTYPGGRVLSYAYDALNRCASISDSGQQLVSYSYDGPDRVSLITYGNGTRTQIAYDGLVGVPNAQGDYGFEQVHRVRHSVINGGTILDDRTFSYDPAQNKVSRDMSSPFTLNGVAQAQSFQYDPADRLVTSLATTNGAVARLVSYGLDRTGNRTNVTGAACSGDYTLSSAVPPADFQMNQYTATPCDSRTYDDNGNLVNVGSSAGPVTYQYDYADRLVQAQTVGFSGGVPTVTTSTYAYDALGRRISKSVSSGGLPPVTTQYSYDVVEYKDGEDGTMRTRPGCVIEERSGGAVAATYLVDDRSLLGLRRNGTDYYLHTDDQGNALALTTIGGAVVERYDCDDYGAVTFLSSDGIPTGATSSSVGNVYLWGGMRLDSETGLHNDDGGNYFEPETGRAVRGKVKSIKDTGSGRAVEGNNPWSGGDGGEMQKKGTVKFFNDPKGFGYSAKQHTKTGHVTLMK